MPHCPLPSVIPSVRVFFCLSCESKSITVRCKFLRMARRTHIFWQTLFFLNKHNDNTKRPIISLCFWPPQKRVPLIVTAIRRGRNTFFSIPSKENYDTYAVFYSRVLFFLVGFLPIVMSGRATREVQDLCPNRLMTQQADSQSQTYSCIYYQYFATCLNIDYRVANDCQTRNHRRASSVNKC